MRDVLVKYVGLSVEEALRCLRKVRERSAKVVMVYHHEPEGWWARSDDLPGFTAAGATFDEVRELAHSGAEFYLERPVEVEDRLPSRREVDGSS